eukprot:jgi/Mesen1/4717/ME000241S03761
MSKPWIVSEAVALLSMAATLEDTVQRLENEKRQLVARLVAVQHGMQQLEREAAIRSRVQLDVAAAAAPDSAKGWLSWKTKDPLAEAVAIAEEARVQRAAATATVEKLMNENAELIEQTKTAMV